MFNRIVRLAFVIFISSFCLFDLINCEQVLTTKKADTYDVSSLFPKTCAEIESIFIKAKVHAQQRIGHIESIPAKKRTFENTVLEYDKALDEFGSVASLLSTLAKVHPDPAIRKKAKNTLGRWSSYDLDLFEMNRGIYRSFREFQSVNISTLSAERQYYFFNVMERFEKDGLNLSEEKTKTLKNLQKKISALSSEFSSNIHKDPSVVLCTIDELQGIGSDFISSLPKQDEYYVLACNTTTSDKVMKNCSVEATRKKYQQVFRNKAYPQNLEVLGKLINGRDELAKLLGYGCYAEFDIAPCMAKTVEHVEGFLDGLTTDAQTAITTTWRSIVSDAPSTISTDDEGKIHPWNTEYLITQHLKRNYTSNSVTSEYFPLDQTLQGLITVFGRFFNLQFTLVNTMTFWDPSVRCVEVTDSNKKLVGHILFDLFPRENKYTHCCCNCIVSPIRIGQDAASGNENYLPAVAVIIANFTKPTTTKPSLLGHEEVVTLFHEFGHAMHALLGHAEMPSLAGYVSTTDFVEMPSQLFEEWAWDRDVLKAISQHYLTRQPLPDHLVDALFSARNIIEIERLSSEILHAKISLEYFKKGQNKDLVQIDKQLFYSTPQIAAFDPMVHYTCTFLHLTAYGSKYYGYLWSKQLARKAFAYIKAHGGPLDPLMGERYRSKIIGKGGSCDPNLLMQDFLGI